MSYYCKWDDSDSAIGYRCFAQCKECAAEQMAFTARCERQPVKWVQMMEFKPSMRQVADERDRQLYMDGYHAGMIAAATICAKYGASVLSRNIASAIERRIYAAIDDMQKQVTAKDK